MIYREVFGERTTFQKGNTIFLSVGTASPYCDEGEVGHRQDLWLGENLRRNRNKVKIVVMHHHVVSVPDTSTDRITIVDAGDMLRTLIAEQVNLVLCGRRHRPWMRKINDLNTYNIIDVNESTWEAKIRLKIIDGKKIDMEEIVIENEVYMPELKFRLGPA